MIQVLVGNVFALKKKIVRLLPIIIALHFDLIANRNEMNIQDNLIKSKDNKIKATLLNIRATLRINKLMVVLLDVKI